MTVNVNDGWNKHNSFLDCFILNLNITKNICFFLFILSCVTHHKNIMWSNCSYTVWLSDWESILTISLTLGLKVQNYSRFRVGGSVKSTLKYKIISQQKITKPFIKKSSI